MINLFNNYDSKAADLKKSLDTSGYKNKTIVLEDDGFISDDVTSPIAFFTGMYNVKKSRPAFFNEVNIPNFWEIRGNGQSADIFDGYKKRGHIVYSSRGEDYRIIKLVEWFNDADKLRQEDLYNKYGNLFAKKTYSDGQLTLTTFFDNDFKETILFNHITDTIQVFYDNKQYIFSSFTEFVLFYFECAQLNVDRIFYNSLAKPFFIVNKLQENQNSNASHILFWQEKSMQIPGNMKSIIDNKDSLTKKIIVQDKNEFISLQKQVENNSKLRYLGFIYDYKENTSFDKTIFILTNSDNIEKLTELVTTLSDWEFNIAALTEMSAKLGDFEKYSNVKLWPTITIEEIKELSKECAIYLDINHSNEVVNIVRQEFDNNKLIFAFDATVHNRDYIDSENVVPNNDVQILMNKIRSKTQSYAIYKQSLVEQRLAAGQSTTEDYKRIIE